MIKKAAILFSCLLLFACSEEKKQAIPANVLSKQKMAEVMLDMHLLEAAINLNTYHVDQANGKDAGAQFNVLAKHQITKEQYDESFDFYSQHPEMLVEIYQSILEGLSKMQAKAMSIKEEKKMVKDTVIVKPEGALKKLKGFKKRK